jgi:hypothetical protein
MAAPDNLEAPVVSGSPIVGSTLSTTNGVWDQADSFTYRWFRGVTAIVGATNSTYALQGADLGQSISSEVTATNVDGSTAAPSNAIGPIRDPVPVNTSPPVASGSALIGSVLSVSTGTWTGNPTSYIYQWYEGANAIVGATDPIYDIQPEDLGLLIACLVTAVNASGQQAILSNWVGPVTAPPLTPAQEYAVWLSRYSYPRPGSRYYG